jgi:hypothetical protein
MNLVELGVPGSAKAALLRLAEAISRSKLNHNKFARLGYNIDDQGRRVFRFVIGNRKAVIKLGKKVIKIHWHVWH